MNLPNPNPTPARRRHVYPAREVCHLFGNQVNDIRDSKGTLRTYSQNGATVLRHYSTDIASVRTLTDPSGSGQSHFRILLTWSGAWSNTTKKHLSRLWSAVPGRANTISGSELPSVLPPFDHKEVFCVRKPNPSGPYDHKANHEELLKEAKEAFEELRKARTARTNPILAFKKADLYRLIFLRAEDVPTVELPADFHEVVSAHAARLERARAKECAEEDRRLRLALEWISQNRDWLDKAKEDWAQLVAHAPKTPREICEDWIKTGKNGDYSISEQMRNFQKDFYDRVMITYPRVYEKERRVFGRLRRAQSWAVTLDPVREYTGICLSNYMGSPVRHCVRLAASGDIMSCRGASVPGSIARALWRRMGAYVRKLNAGEVIQPSAPVAFGHYSFNRVETATSAEIEAGASPVIMIVGCHRISPGDLLRNAEENGWNKEGGAE